jgi:very-short-patch-repair endonuclease
MVWQAGGGRHNTDADRDKINTATLLGWRILRFSGAQIKKKPQECINMTVALIKNQVQSHV